MDCITAVVEKQSCQKLREKLESLHLYDGDRRCTTISEHDVSIPLTEDAMKHPELCHIEGELYSLRQITFRITRNIRECKTSKVQSLYQKLLHEVKKLMIEKQLWENMLENEIPKHWEKFGDLVFFNLTKSFKHPNWETAGSDLWMCVCKCLNANRIALKHHIKNDSFRSPSVKLVWGNSSWVACTDNGIKYTWDIERNMFSAGNAPERHRVAKMACTDQVVVDMYAGIGYFTLPYLVHAKANLVHACEWNPYAVKALRKNLELNNVSEACIVHEGDNRMVCPTGVADRVNLGLLPSSQDSWDAACLALKSTGGILHVHENVSELPKSIDAMHSETQLISRLCRRRFDSTGTSDLGCETCKEVITGLPKTSLSVVPRSFFLQNLSSHQSSFFVCTNNFAAQTLSEITLHWRRLEWKVWALHVCHSICSILSNLNNRTSDWKVSVTHLHNVKSYAPHIDHLVLDIKCEPLNC